LEKNLLRNSLQSEKKRDDLCFGKHNEMKKSEENYK